MRILMTTDAVGGVWQYALDLAAGLGEHGDETVLAVLGPAPADWQRREAAAIPGMRLIETELPLDWLANEAAEVEETAAAIAQLAKCVRADLVHLNSPALAAGPCFDVPVVAVCHSCVATWWATVRGGPLPPLFAWQAALTRKGLLYADSVIAPTEAFAADLRNTYALPLPPAAVHNGRAPAPDVTAPDDEDALFAFTAGRLWDEGKNVALLDEAAPRLPVKVRAAGSLTGPNGACVRLRHVEALGSLDRAAMTAELARRPIFISSALYEPFGLAVLEAAQAGCPLVLSDIPTMRELWGGAAVFFDPADPTMLTEAIAMLAGDAAPRRAFGEAARKRADAYGLAAMCDRMAAVYRAALQPDRRIAVA